MVETRTAPIRRLLAILTVLNAPMPCIAQPAQRLNRDRGRFAQVHGRAIAESPLNRVGVYLKSVNRAAQRSEPRRVDAGGFTHRLALDDAPEGYEMFKH